MDLSFHKRVVAFEGFTAKQIDSIQAKQRRFARNPYYGPDDLRRFTREQVAGAQLALREQVADSLFSVEERANPHVTELLATNHDIVGQLPFDNLEYVLLERATERAKGRTLSFKVFLDRTRTIIVFCVWPS